MEELQHWFQTKNYASGIVLYQNLIGQDSTFSFLKLGENSLSRKKMIAAFEKLLQKATSIQKTNQAPAQIRRNYSSPSDSDIAPLEIKQLVEERIQLYNATRAAHEKMKLMVDDEKLFNNEQRAELSKFIKKSFVRIKEIWKQTDYFDKNLQPMPKLESVSIEEIDMSMNFYIKRRNALRVYLTPSYRAKLNPEKIAKYEQELEAIETKLIMIENAF